MRPRRYRLGALLLAALFGVALPACSDAPATRPVVVRDSAGVTVVDHGRVNLETVPQWSLSPTPLLRIGTADGDERLEDERLQFDRVRDVARLRDGPIVVIDGSRTIRRFDADGTPRWTAGREGNGPGEFQAPTMIAELAGDSLVVWDAGAARLSVFTPAGAFVRAATVPNVGTNTRVWGVPGERQLLVGALRFERTRIDGHNALVHSMDMHVIDLDGTVARPLGLRDFATEFQEVDENGAFSPAIFTTYPAIGASRDGFWYGDPATSELREESAADQPRRIVRWEGAERTVTDADVKALLAKWTDETDNPAARSFFAEYGRTHPRADRFPAYEALHVDELGRLWLQDYVREDRNDEHRRWTILSADGTAILGRLSHPIGFDVHDIGESWILGVEKNELDVETLALYRIITER